MTSAPDHGPAHIAPALVLEDVATGTRGTFKRARRRDNLAALNLAAAELQALTAWRQAAEHVQAGRGMGPLPWARDAPRGGVGEALPEQMRSLSAAEWYRRGVQAAGQVAWPVLAWVVLSGGTLASYDATRRWREGTARCVLVEAAERMAVAYGFAMRRAIGTIKPLDAGRI